MLTHMAQAKFAALDQKAVDKIFFEAAMAGSSARLPLAELAVAETKVCAGHVRSFVGKEAEVVVEYITWVVDG